MQIANFNRYQFIDQSVMNAAHQAILTNFDLEGAFFRTPGIANGVDITTTPSALTVTVSAAPPVGFQFSSGVYAQALGTTAGASASSYPVNFASFVPASGSTTVYVVAQAATLAYSGVTIVGPPPGHPDYDPTFSPTLGYVQSLDTVTMTATTTPPNGTTAIEVFRTSLTPGQTAITGGQIDVTHQVTAGSWVTSSNVTTGLGYTPVNKAGDTMSGNLIVSSTQSGGASNSPNITYLGWTGAASISHALSETSAGVLQLANAAGSIIHTISQAGDVSIQNTLTGAASGSPTLYLQGWTSTQAIGHYLQETSAGLLGVFALTGGGAQLTLDQSGKFTVAGVTALSGAVTLSSTLTVSGTSALSGAVVASNNLTVSGTSALSGAVTASSTLTVSGATTLKGTTTVPVGNFPGTMFANNYNEVTIFTANGNFTPLFTGNYLVYGIGGGGGGGGGGAGSSGTGGGGGHGGAGGQLGFSIVTLVAGTPYAVVIGTGGAGGNDVGGGSGNPGSSGATTTFSGSVIAVGGIGGLGGTLLAGSNNGQGGSGSNGGGNGGGAGGATAAANGISAAVNTGAGGGGAAGGSNANDGGTGGTGGTGILIVMRA